MEDIAYFSVDSNRWIAARKGSCCLGQVTSLFLSGGRCCEHLPPYFLDGDYVASFICSIFFGFVLQSFDLIYGVMVTSLFLML